VLGSKIAVTERAPLIEIVQAAGFPPTGVQPTQFLKIEPSAGVAVSVTVVYAVVLAGLSIGAVQPAVEPVVQATPPPVTVPAPVPDTVRVSGKALGSNRAVIVFAALTEAVQEVGSLASGVQPIQLLKTEPLAGTALTVTVVYAEVSPGLSIGAVQPAVEPVVQESPGPVTVPAPVPFIAIVSGNVAGSNRAVMVREEPIVVVQLAGSVASGVQPTQLLNTEPGDGVAARVTLPYALEFPGLSTWTVQPAEEPVVHWRPAPVIVPAPVPMGVAVSGNVAGSNRALMDREDEMEVVQVVGSVASAEHPTQLLNTDPVDGAAWSVTVGYALE
jgi:hypothetical protein